MSRASQLGSAASVGWSVSATVMRWPDVMRMTAPMMRPAATSERAVIGSSLTTHPSATATIGLTYAWVATRYGVETRSSQRYVVKAMRQPTRVR